MASWVRVPFGTPFKSGMTPPAFPALGNFAWHNKNNLWLIDAGEDWTNDTMGGSYDCWILVDSLCPNFSIAISGTTQTLEHSGFLHGYPVFANSTWKFFFDGSAWVLAKTFAPLAYVDRYDGALGDDYYVESNSNSHSHTVRFTGHGPNAGGASITGTWIWPRLCHSSQDGALDEKTGIYDSAKDGWTGAARVIVGTRSFSGDGAGDMDKTHTKCGEASYDATDGVWRIGAESLDGVWWECSQDLAAADRVNATYTFTAHAGQDYEVELPQQRVWTFDGFNGPEAKKAQIWVVDVARWL